MLVKETLISKVTTRIPIWTKHQKRQALVVVSIGDEHQFFYSLTRPSIEAYAGRIGATLLNLDGVDALPANLVDVVRARSTWSERDPLPYVAKCWAIYNALGKFQRVALLDSTCVVQRQCANLFDLIPPNSIGGFDESTLSEFMSWRIDACLAKEKRGIDLPVYFNTGVLVISICHRCLLSPTNIINNLDLFHGPYADQLFINIVIAQSNAQIYKLPRTYNYVPVFNYADESQRKISRLDTTQLQVTCEEDHIIHVTGYFEHREFILTQIIRHLFKSA